MMGTYQELSKNVTGMSSSCLTQILYTLLGRTLGTSLTGRYNFGPTLITLAPAVQKKNISWTADYVDSVLPTGFRSLVQYTGVNRPGRTA
jgi:hypothetical protein